MRALTVMYIPYIDVYFTGDKYISRNTNLFLSAVLCFHCIISVSLKKLRNILIIYRHKNTRAHVRRRVYTNFNVIITKKEHIQNTKKSFGYNVRTLCRYNKLNYCILT